ncbi:hypothetical protein [Microbulbifer sp. JMSA002]|uniref:hypothetical protein n=1 Tax=Microbulbifer sp. JMSA002 TaxID=3243368 RepID=UPI00403A5195
MVQLVNFLNRSESFLFEKNLSKLTPNSVEYFKSDQSSFGYGVFYLSLKRWRFACLYLENESLFFSADDFSIELTPDIQFGWSRPLPGFLHKFCVSSNDKVLTNQSYVNPVLQRPFLLLDNSFDGLDREFVDFFYWLSIDLNSKEWREETIRRWENGI